jgi:hypothetical protein
MALFSRRFAHDFRFLVRLLRGSISMGGIGCRQVHRGAHIRVPRPTYNRATSIWSRLILMFFTALHNLLNLVVRKGVVAP